LRRRQRDIRIEILQKCIGKNPHQVRLGEQADGNRRARRSRWRAGRETADQTGGFNAARRVDVPQEVVFRVAEAHLHRLSGRAKPRDKVGFTRLRRPEHGHPHRARGRHGEALRTPAAAPEVPDERAWVRLQASPVAFQPEGRIRGEARHIRGALADHGRVFDIHAHLGQFRFNLPVSRQ
jgi:hypothetical protein